MDYTAFFQAPAHPDAGHRVITLGNLYVPTGKLYCCDPFRSGDVRALAQNVPPGHYPVRLSLMQIPPWGRRVAFAALVLRPDPLTGWQPATFRRGRDVTNEFWVQGGLACFMDEDTVNLFGRTVDRFYQQHPNGNYYDDVLASEFKKSGDPASPAQSGDWDLHYPVPGDPRNVAMFASGPGDGVYTAHWGMTGDKPVVLVADFGLVP